MPAIFYFSGLKGIKKSTYGSKQPFMLQIWRWLFLGKISVLGQFKNEIAG